MNCLFSFSNTFEDVSSMFYNFAIYIIKQFKRCLNHLVCDFSVCFASQFNRFKKLMCSINLLCIEVCSILCVCFRLPFSNGFNVFCYIVCEDCIIFCDCVRAINVPAKEDISCSLKFVCSKCGRCQVNIILCIRCDFLFIFNIASAISNKSNLVCLCACDKFDCNVINRHCKNSVCDACVCQSCFFKFNKIITIFNFFLNCDCCTKLNFCCVC